MDNTILRKGGLLINMKMKGSLTIEAALLMPFVLATMIILIYLAFYLHDQAVLTSCAYEAAIMGSHEQSEDEIEQVIEEKIKELTTNRLLGTIDVKNQINVDNKVIMIRFEGNFKLSGMQMIHGLISPNDMPVIAEASVNIIKPIEFIRNCRVIEQLKEKMEE